MRDGITPNALVNSSCCLAVVIASTKLMAWSLNLVLLEMPQHWVNESVPLVPDGPAGIGTARYLMFGKSCCMAPLIQLPSVVIAALPLPKASPPQPASSCFG